MEMENNSQFKYIVYQTTNLVNNKIYIGVHKTINPNVFDGYIGCGCKVNEPNTYEHAKTAFQCAVKKHGPKNFVRTTLAIYNTEQEAYAMEELLVNEEFLAREDVYNMVLGGASGMYNSEMIKVYQYDENGTFIKEFKSMAEAGASFGKRYTAISSAVAYKVKAFGYFWSKEKVDKLSLDDYNLGINQRKKVYVYDKDGNFKKEFPSQTKAAEYIGTSIGDIGRSCLLGNMTHNFYCCWVYNNNYSIARSNYIKTRPVYKYNSEGKFLEEYITQQEAEQNNPKSNITKSIRLKQPDEYGFMWAIEKVANYNVHRDRYKGRKVGMYDTNNKLIKEFPTATQAAREMGNAVWHALSGRNAMHKGYIFKYLS